MFGLFKTKSYHQDDWFLELPIQSLLTTFPNRVTLYNKKTGQRVEVVCRLSTDSTLTTSDGTHHINSLTLRNGADGASDVNHVIDVYASFHDDRFALETCDRSTFTWEINKREFLFKWDLPSAELIARKEPGKMNKTLRI